ncbi:LacI family DNA-binding transcriptional regulator [Rhodospirillales bacterium]|nr:LacI family DNA-binding transcriptional regulator [Rhodospirillales bacterium]
MKNSSVPTLEDVAGRAGVSTATVSRCMNSPDRVQKNTRDRVMAAVRELGYFPNFGARALMAKHTNTIGVIIPTMENAVFARGIQAFQEALREKGVALFIASFSYQESLEAEQIRTLTARGADGLLLIGHHRSEDLYQFLANRDVPVLCAWVYDAAEPRLSIGFNNREAMKGLAEAVLEKGHQSIGVISADQQSNDRARERVSGIRDAIQDAGLSPDALQLIETPYGIENGAVAFQDFMSRPNAPTVIMCGNDVLATGALHGAKKMGLRVPDDISITGFDDIELASIADPELTTVHVPHREMGKRAAQMLIDMVNGTPPTESVELKTWLCLRGSLGPAAPTPVDS